jgi:hypothetical protein
MNAAESLFLLMLSVLAAAALSIIPLMWAGYWVTKGIRLAGGLGA